MDIPKKQIRASFNDKTIRVYQAYSNEIADSVLLNKTFVSPPFKRTRMTWIKPSFLWMMYRAGWGYKDDGQYRILAIDITHAGFAWALNNSCESHASAGMSQAAWEDLKRDSPVRIQWDPERDLHHNALDYRSIQIGLSATAVELYVDQWIQNITDVTVFSQSIKVLVDRGEIESAKQQLPLELPYTVFDAV
jgi:hypothetical protein